MNAIGERTSRLILGSVIAFSLVIVVFFLWLFWPYPTVTSKGTPVLTNLPADGTYVTGDVVRWTTPEVCQPNGVTEVSVIARMRFPLPNGDLTVETPTVERSFNLPEGNPACIKNNKTSMFVEGNLPSGMYELEIRACVLNPTPRPRCTTTPGPKIQVFRPESLLSGLAREPRPVP